MRLSPDIPVRVFPPTKTIVMRLVPGRGFRHSTVSRGGRALPVRTFLIAHFRLRELPRRHGAYLFQPEPPLPSSMYMVRYRSSFFELFTKFAPVRLHFAACKLSRFAKPTAGSAKPITKLKCCHWARWQIPTLRSPPKPTTLQKNGRASSSRRRRGAAGAVDC